MRHTVIVAAVALTAAGVPSAAAKSHHKPACAKHLPKAKLVTSTLLVWSKRKHTSYYAPATVYFGCLRPHGKSVKLGVNGPTLAEYGPAATFGGFATAGTFVAAHASSGEADSTMCFKYNPMGPCPFPQYWTSVTDVKTRRHAALTLALDTAEPLVLSPNGAMAWLESGSTLVDLWATPLHPSGKSFSTSPAKLDSGAIDAASLKFSGSTLSWTNGGVPHQQVIQ